MGDPTNSDTPTPQDMAAPGLLGVSGAPDPLAEPVLSEAAQRAAGEEREEAEKSAALDAGSVLDAVETTANVVEAGFGIFDIFDGLNF